MNETETLYSRAAEIVKSGGLVVLPTETFYALAATPFDEGALRRVFRIKRRDETMPLPLIASDTAKVETMVSPLSPMVRKLIDCFWPGSLTILLNPSRRLSPLLLGPQGKIGVRVPPACAAGIVANLVGGWVTATSANLSGDPSPDEVLKIAREVLEAVDMVLDLGRAPGGKPSTVVEPLNGDFRVLREGAIPESVIKEHCVPKETTNR